MKNLRLYLLATALLIPAGAIAQGLNPADLTKPLSDSWPTYSGDYSGKRYSALAQINQANVTQLTLKWTTKVPVGLPAAGGGGRGGFGGFGGGNATPTIVAGEGTGELNESGTGGRASRIVCSILEVNGMLYASTPDNAWAIDARDGRVKWHYVWKTKGGTHTGNRGLGMWGNWLYMETPDDYLVSIDARTGQERWHKPIAALADQYFSTNAPIVVGNHVLVGTGNDLDSPAFLKSYDPETGDVQWTWLATPRDPNDPAMKTWKNLDAAIHGGGHMWIPGSYDPETHLYIIGTGNPTPAYTSQTRGEGDNLYTCSLVAINVDTGKLAWHFQTSPHDTHDWDSTQTPVLVDAPFNGKPRKLVLQATRNGYFFVLDRVTGQHLVTSAFSPTVNWAKGIDSRGEPVRLPEKDFDVAGALVSPTNAGATNWMPPAFDPNSGLFFVTTEDSYAMYYLTELDPRGAMGLGGKAEVGAGTLGTFLTALDYKTGKIAWRHQYPEAGAWGGTNVGHGLLTTAGKLLFGGDPGGNLVAYDPATGKILWHSQLRDVSNSPQTYLLDGKQYILIAAVDSLYAFALY
jgi:alcohol dehydrogenase (cytochrome c)